MSNRRLFLMLTAALLLPTGRLVGAAVAQPGDDRAGSFIMDIGNKLVAVVNDPASNRDKRARLTAVIDEAVDVDGVARFSLGRFWHNASAAQQQRYIALFHQVLLNYIASKLGDYRGVRFTLGRVQHRDDNAVVSTVVERPNNPPTNVDWIISNSANAPKIIDVIAEGTSLRLTQRQDYASYLTRNNNSVDALIDAMRQQIATAG
jgi:phospholipid transport system substrate-binding protein